MYTERMIDLSIVFVAVVFLLEGIARVFGHVNAKVLAWLWLIAGVLLVINLFTHFTVGPFGS